VLGGEPGAEAQKHCAGGGVEGTADPVAHQQAPRAVQSSDEHEQVGQAEDRVAPGQQEQPAQARARGEDADEAAVLADIIARDERDQNRPVAPLKRASDAYLLDNSNLDIEGGVRAAIDIVEAVRAGRQRI